MHDDDRRILPSRIEGGPTILVEARTPLGVEEKVAAKDLPFEGITDAVQAVAQRVDAAVKEAKPDRAIVQLGIDIAVGPGGLLTALIAKGSASANLQITLEWSGDEPQ